MQALYLSEIRNPHGRTIVSRVDVSADDCIGTLAEFVHAIGLDPWDVQSNGSIPDAVSSCGVVGTPTNTPETWESPNGTRVVFQLVRAD